MPVFVRRKGGLFRSSKAKLVKNQLPYGRWLCADAWDMREALMEQIEQRISTAGQRHPQ